MPLRPQPDIHEPAAPRAHRAAASHAHGGRFRRGRLTPMRTLAVALIRAYQALMPPLYRGGCRHQPTCSEFAKEAIMRHGLLKGGRLALGRIARCHPFGSAGYDPVP